MTLGFIGIGHIASALVTGLCASPGWSEPILLSPRNRANAAALASRLAPVRVAADNQAVLDGSDSIVLALRPQQAPEALSGLRWRPDQPILSLMAMLPEASVRRLTGSAAPIVRAVPLPTAAERQGPIAIWPGDPAAAALLARAGTVIVAESEPALHAFWAVTGLVSTYYGVADRLASWLQHHDIEAGEAAAYVGSFLQAIGGTLAQAPGSGFAGLARAASTRGGLNEQASRELAQAGWFASLEPALDGILRRLEGGTAPPEVG
jgi:pyrroline-5-carboxylate reductase